MNASLKIDINLPKECKNKRQAIINSVRFHRMVARKCFGILTTISCAGATIDVDDPANPKIYIKDRSQQELLAKFFGKEGKRSMYAFKPYIKEIAPTWLSRVSDDLRTTLSKRWIGKDPEINASSGFLTLQGVRRPAVFPNLGISINNSGYTIDPENRCINIKWDYDIGTINFKIPGKLDRSRYYIWKQLSTGADGWKMGTIYISEKDNKIFLVITYSKPDLPTELDPKKTLEVSFNEDSEEFFITMNAPKMFDSCMLSASEAVGWLSELRSLQDKYEMRKKATGNVKRPESFKKGYRGIQNRVHKLTIRRANGVQTRNHNWSKRIITTAERFRCGKIIIKDYPIQKDDLFGHPWAWYQLQTYLKYKAKTRGITNINMFYRK